MWGIFLILGLTGLYIQQSVFLKPQHAAYHSRPCFEAAPGPLYSKDGERQNDSRLGDSHKTDSETNPNEEKFANGEKPAHGGCLGLGLEGAEECDKGLKNRVLEMKDIYKHCTPRDYEKYRRENSMVDRIILLLVDGLRFDILAPHDTKWLNETGRSHYDQDIDTITTATNATASSGNASGGSRWLNFGKKNRGESSHDNRGGESDLDLYTPVSSADSRVPPSIDDSVERLSDVYGQFPIIARALQNERERTRLFRVRTATPTLTLQRVATMMSGSQPSQFDLGFLLKNLVNTARKILRRPVDPAATADSIVHQTYASMDDDDDDDEGRRETVRGERRRRRPPAGENVCGVDTHSDTHSDTPAGGTIAIGDGIWKTLYSNFLHRMQMTQIFSPTGWLNVDRCLHPTFWDALECGLPLPTPDSPSDTSSDTASGMMISNRPVRRLQPLIRRVSPSKHFQELAQHLSQPLSAPTSLSASPFSSLADRFPADTPSRGNPLAKLVGGSEGRAPAGKTKDVRRWKLLVAHFLGADFAGHFFETIKTAHYKRRLRLYDDLFDNVRFFVTRGEMGHRFYDTNRHEGLSDIEDDRYAALIAADTHSDTHSDTHRDTHSDTHTDTHSENSGDKRYGTLDEVGDERLAGEGEMQRKERVMVLVVGDHGVTNSGNHGWRSDEELYAGAFVWSTERLMANVPFFDKLRKRQYHDTYIGKLTTERENFIDVEQNGLAATLAILLGLPIPTEASGIPWFDLFPAQTRSKTPTSFRAEEDRQSSKMEDLRRIEKALRSYAWVNRARLHWSNATEKFDQENQELLQSFLRVSDAFYDTPKIFTALQNFTDNGSNDGNAQQIHRLPHIRGADENDGADGDFDEIMQRLTIYKNFLDQTALAIQSFELPMSRGRRYQTLSFGLTVTAFLALFLNPHTVRQTFKRFQNFIPFHRFTRLNSLAQSHTLTHSHTHSHTVAHSQTLTQTSTNSVPAILKHPAIPMIWFYVLGYVSFTAFSWGAAVGTSRLFLSIYLACVLAYVSFRKNDLLLFLPVALLHAAAHALGEYRQNRDDLAAFIAVILAIVYLLKNTIARSANCPLCHPNTPPHTLSHTLTQPHRQMKANVLGGEKAGFFDRYLGHSVLCLTQLAFAAFPVILPKNTIATTLSLASVLIYVLQKPLQRLRGLAFDLRGRRPSLPFRRQSDGLSTLLFLLLFYSLRDALILILHFLALTAFVDRTSVDRTSVDRTSVDRTSAADEEDEASHKGRGIVQGEKREKREILFAEAPLLKSSRDEQASHLRGRTDRETYVRNASTTSDADDDGPESVAQETEQPMRTTTGEKRDFGEQGGFGEIGETGERIGKTTQDIVGKVTQSPTQSSTQSPTHSPTHSPTQSSTQSPTQLSYQHKVGLGSASACEIVFPVYLMALSAFYDTGHRHDLNSIPFGAGLRFFLPKSKFVTTVAILLHCLAPYFIALRAVAHERNLVLLFCLFTLALGSFADMTAIQFNGAFYTVWFPYAARLCSQTCAASIVVTVAAVALAGRPPTIHSHSKFVNR